MKANKMKIDLNLLDRVDKVEAPPYLYTRILQKIASAKEDKFSPGMSWAMGFAFASLLLINALVLRDGSDKFQHMKHIAQYFELQPDNELYHE